MKKIVIFFAIIFSLSKLQAQIISSEIITSNGDFYSNSTAMLSFSEGVVINEVFLPSANSINNNWIVSNSIKIYPNPVTDKVTIETSAIQTNGQLSIITLTGQQLISRQVTELETVIDLSTLPSGVYFVRLTNDKTVQVGKFIKQ
jgi:hypothetical protein